MLSFIVPLAISFILDAAQDSEQEDRDTLRMEAQVLEAINAVIRTDPRPVLARQMKCLFLRCQGKSHAEISQETGVGKDHSRHDLRKGAEHLVNTGLVKPETMKLVLKSWRDRAKREQFKPTRTYPDSVMDEHIKRGWDQGWESTRDDPPPPVPDKLLQWFRSQERRPISEVHNTAKAASFRAAVDKTRKEETLLRQERARQEKQVKLLTLQELMADEDEEFLEAIHLARQMNLSPIRKRQMDALVYRHNGLSGKEIARAQGTSMETAHKDFQRGIRFLVDENLMDEVIAERLMHRWRSRVFVRVRRDGSLESGG